MRNNYCNMRKRASGYADDYPFGSPEFTGAVGGALVGVPLGALIAGKGRRLKGAVQGGAAATLVGLGLGMYGRQLATREDELSDRWLDAHSAFYELYDRLRKSGIPVDNVRVPKAY